MASQYPTTCKSVLKGHEGIIMKVRFNEDGKYCMTAGQDKTVRLWNPHKSLPVKIYKAHGSEVYDMAISPDNSRFVSVGQDKLALFWDVSTGQVIRRFRGHSQRVNACALNAEATLLMTGSYDATVKIYDLKQRNYEPCEVLDQAKDSISVIVLDEPTILVGSIDGCVRCYDVRMGQLSTDVFDAPVTSVSISNDRKCILVSTMDETIRLLDRVGGEVLSSYTGHLNTQYRVDSVLTNTDAHIMSGSEDGTLKIWDLVESCIIQSLEGHSGAAVSLSYHPNEACCVSAGFDGTLRYWR